MSKEQSVLVIGGGIAGIQASLDLAEQGYKVHLVEKQASIGGKMALLDKTFPTMDCSVCILAPKMIETSRHPNINIISYSEIKGVEGETGDFKVKVWVKPRGVDPEICNGCALCSGVCPALALDQFNENMMERTAIYRPFAQAVPNIFTIDFEACIGCRACERICPVNAIDIDDPGKKIELNVDAIIVSTGLETFDPSTIKELGYGRYENVITAFEMERMLSATGCTSGELLRLSDDKHPKDVTFLQCVGSRSMKEGYPYCSAVCCMHATKEAILAKEHTPGTEVTIFYTDIRAFGKDFRDFVNRAMNEYGVEYVRAKPSEIREDPDTKNLSFWYEDTLTGKLAEKETELLILCTALAPSDDNSELAKILGVIIDEHGFFVSPDPIMSPLGTTRAGVYMCGYSQSPKDIPDTIAEASGAAAMVGSIMSKGVEAQR